MPSASTEALSIQSQFKRSIHLHADSASTLKIESVLNKTDFVHFACHGDTNADSPLNASLHLPSGEIWTAEFVATNLDFRGKLCVLNCCKTGEQRKQIAGESFSIASGFLAAGATGVVAALWSLPDKESEYIIRKFYKSVSAETPLLAISNVQREAISEEIHPLFWAPFVYLGIG